MYFARPEEDMAYCTTTSTLQIQYYALPILYTVA